MSDAGQGPGAIERPALGNEPGDYWGSDAAALMLREIGLPYVALNPGASYRGLHDSLVNLLGNRDPQMLLCLHEEHAVAIAHGYAKATGEPMACVLHSNVGLLHGMMGLFNAWCDRVPMIVLGATGPVAAEKRRPWIDWIHTSRDQGAYIRSIIKWDDQPLHAAQTSAAAARGGRRGGGDPQGRQATGRHVWARFAQAGCVGCAHKTCRAARRLRAHRSQAGRRVPERSSGALHAAVQRARQGLA
jgi:hypothetical protein